MRNRNEFNQYTENQNDLKRHIIVCQENKSTYRYINNAGKTVAKIRVDGGLINEKTIEKCDWLLVNWDDGLSYFIELKGSDVRKAIVQIQTTINELSPSLSALNVTAKNVRIVPTRDSYPDISRGTEYKRLKKQVNQTGGTIIIKSRELIDSV
jgi:hypothetical protein